MSEAFYTQWPGLFEEAHRLADDAARDRVTVLTPTIRPDGALRAAESVQAARAQAPDLDVRHVIAYWPGEPNYSRERVAPWFTALMRQQPPGWLFVVDDDNVMHPAFLTTLQRSIAGHPDAWAFLFGMDYPQFPRGILKPSLPPRGGHVDGGQMALWRDYAVTVPWPLGGYGDGIYLATLYEQAPDRWVTIPDVVTYHNKQTRQP